jgi:hypothetical protein
MFEVVTPPTGPSGKPLLSDALGNVAEVVGMTRDERNGLILLDKEGKTIERLAPTPVQRPDATVGEATGIARKLVISGQPVFIDSAGNVIQTEVGQADDLGDSFVLISTNESLVYYITIVNDVFAYMRTAAVNNGITPAPALFPTTQAELDKIIAFAGAHGKAFSDSETLTIELKTSWVEAAGLPNSDTYITTDATIPTFDKSNPKKWTLKGQKTAKLAMVGMHLVGSAAGHPEMIWATFEHINNAPIGAYTYFDVGDNKKTVSQITSGSWLFSRPNSNGPFNSPHMTFSANNIEAVLPFNVSQSDTIRWKAWGATFGVSPNPIDGSDAASNTEILSINNSVRRQIVDGDVRGNYIFVGATWTIGGAAPDSSNQAGTSKLANSTMETYQQGASNSGGGTNCFSCHKSNQTVISHVYGHLNPLF